MKRKKDLVLFDREAITRCRVNRLMTRDELAQKSHCSRKTIWCAHNGIPITLSKARDVARALGVSLRSLCNLKNGHEQGGSESSTEHAGREPATAGAA